MGYSIYQLETKFFISEKFKSKALSSLKRLVKNFNESKKNIAFVEKFEIQHIAELEQLLTDLRWIPENNLTGDIIEINFSGEKLGDDFEIFKCIAPFVKKDSFITFIINDGENSKVQRWIFLDKNILELQGRLIFE